LTASTKLQIINAHVGNMMKTGATWMSLCQRTEKLKRRN